MNWQDIQQHSNYYSDDKLKLMVLSIAIRELIKSGSVADIANAACNMNGFDYMVLSGCSNLSLEIPFDLQKILTINKIS